MPEPDDIDRLLDSALSSYAMPANGLEDRVLRALASQPGIRSADRRPRVTRRWLPWAVAVPVAAAIALFFLSISRTPAPPVNHAQSAPQSQAPVRPFESSTPRPPSPPARSVHRIHLHPGHTPQMAMAPTLPKQNIFPSPQPLSPEERALAAIAAHAPESVRQSLIDSQTQDAPITISAIEIQPLKMPDPGHN